MNKMRKHSKKTVLGIIILMIVALFIGKNILSFSPTIPPFPIVTLAKANSVVGPYPGGFSYSGAQVYYNGIFPADYIYEGISYVMPIGSDYLYYCPYGTPCGGVYGSHARIRRYYPIIA